MINIEKFDIRFKNIIQSMYEGIATIYDDFIYEGYITIKYKQRLNNIKLLTVHNLKDLPDNETKNEVLKHIEILKEIQSMIKEDIEDDEVLLVYLLLKLYLLCKNCGIGFNYKGKNLTLNAKVLEEIMIEFNNDIYDVFKEHLIVKEENDDIEGAISLNDI